MAAGQIWSFSTIRVRYFVKGLIRLEPELEQELWDGIWRLRHTSLELDYQHVCVCVFSPISVLDWLLLTMSVLVRLEFQPRRTWLSPLFRLNCDSKPSVLKCCRSSGGIFACEALLPTDCGCLCFSWWFSLFVQHKMVVQIPSESVGCRPHTLPVNLSASLSVSCIFVICVHLFFDFISNFPVGYSGYLF